MADVKKDVSPKGSKKKAQVKKKDDSEYFSIKTIALIVLLAIGFFLFSSSVGFNGSGSGDKSNDEGLDSSISLEAFDYVNDYRGSNDIDSLRYSNEAFDVASSMSSKKQVNSGEYSRASDRISFVNENLNVDNISSSYVGIYEIDSLGISEFKRQFDEIYFIRNIVNSDRYDYGAVGCSDDYCTLIMYKLQELNSTEELVA